MKEFEKNKILNRIIYLILILLIILSSAYIVKSFVSKKEAEIERNLLNSVNVENTEESEEEKNSEGEENGTKDENNKNVINEETKNDNSAKQEKSEEEILKEKEAASDKRKAQVAKLKEEYKNIIGWIEIKDTHISYPVVQGKDNEFYLTHDYKGDNAERGAIFLDSNYNWNIEGNNLMIYGHYMINNEMFTDLTKYIKEDFYKEHSVIRFTTENEDAEYDIIAVFRSKVYNKNDKDVFKYYNFMNSESEKEYSSFIKNIKEASIYNINETAEYGDKLITLTTCSYYTEDGRFVVVGRKKS